MSFKYIVENMTQVIMDATPLKIEKPIDPVLEKHKKKYNELLGYYEELEVNSKLRYRK